VFNTIELKEIKKLMAEVENIFDPIYDNFDIDYLMGMDVFINRVTAEYVVNLKDP